MKRNGTLRPVRVLVLLCTVLFFYGFYLGGVQLVIREVSEHYSMDLTGMGLLVSAQHIAGVLMPVVFGMLADRLGKKYVLCTFSAVFAAGLLLSGTSQMLGAYLFGAVLIGAGYSVCESVSSSLLAELNPEKSLQYINLSQGLLSLGAVVSPVLLQLLRSRWSLSWRLPFLICAGAYALLTLLLLITVFPQQQKPQAEKRGFRTDYFKNSAFLFLFLAIFVYVGLENGISYFAESLFSVRLNASHLGAAAISAYWIGMTASRFVFSAFLRRPKRLLTACFAASAVLLALLGILKNPMLCLALCALVGFSYGPVWSTLVGSAAGLFPDASAGATGLMSAGCGLGGIVAPALMGAVGANASLSAAFLMLAATAALGLLFARLGCKQ